MAVADDRDPGDLGQLLRAGAEEEAKALRAELLAFLRSDDCKDEVANVLRDPLEKAIASALEDQHFVEAIGAKVAAALRPIVEASAKQAAEAVVKEHIPIALPEAFGSQVQQRVVTAVDKAFQTVEEKASADMPELGKKVRLAAGSAIVKAIGEAAGNLPAKWDYPIGVAIDGAVRAAMEKATARVAKEAAAERSSGREDVPGPGPGARQEEAAAPPGPPVGVGQGVPRPRLFLGAVWGIVAVVIVSLVFGALRACPPAPLPDGRASVKRPAEDRYGYDPVPPPEEQPSPSPRLLFDFQTKLEGLHAYTLAKDIPVPSNTEMACVATAITAAEASGIVDHQRLRKELGACDATKVAPAASTLLVAILQDELKRLPESCRPTGPALKLDGYKGNDTQKALDAYRKCKGKESLKLETLADYVAVSLAMLDEQRGANLP